MRENPPPLVPEPPDRYTQKTNPLVRPLPTNVEKNPANHRGWKCKTRRPGLQLPPGALICRDPPIQLASLSRLSLPRGSKGSMWIFFFRSSSSSPTLGRPVRVCDFRPGSDSGPLLSHGSRLRGLFFSCGIASGSSAVGRRGRQGRAEG